jgi:hypothetical protein
MIKKLCLMLIALIVIGGSASAEEYGGVYHGWLTNDYTVAADSSDTATIQTDTSDYDLYVIDGSVAHIRFRYKTDAIYTAAKDTRSFYVDCTPWRHHTDSANLMENLYTATDATPTAAWEYTSVFLDLVDSAAAHRHWKIYYICKDSLTDAMAADSAGLTHSDSLEYWIEVWK